MTRRRPTGLLSDDMLTGTDLTYRQLDYWTRLGHLRASDAEPGSGQFRRWPEIELEVAASMLRLRDVGFELDAAARIAREHVEQHAMFVRLTPDIGIIIEQRKAPS